MLKQTQAVSDADKSPSAHISTIDTESVLKCTLQLCTFLWGSLRFKQQKALCFLDVVLMSEGEN